MSNVKNKFDTEAENIIKNAPKPDAEATTIRELSSDGDPTPEKKKRGRPVGWKPKNKKEKSDSGISAEEYEWSAKAINSLVFSTLCIAIGTADAWPEKEREELLDKSLTRYMTSKNYYVPPEVILLGGYAKYINSVFTKETVLEKLNQRFGAWKKIKLINGIAEYFRKRKDAAKTQQENGEKKGWLENVLKKN